MVGRSLLSLNPSLAICRANGNPASLSWRNLVNSTGFVTLSEPTKGIGGLAANGFRLSKLRPTILGSVHPRRWIIPSPTDPTQASYSLKPEKRASASFNVS